MFNFPKRKIEMEKPSNNNKNYFLGSVDKCRRLWRMKHCFFEKNNAKDVPVSGHICTKIFLWNSLVLSHLKSFPAPELQTYSSNYLRTCLFGCLHDLKIKFSKIHFLLFSSHNLSPSIVPYFCVCPSNPPNNATLKIIVPHFQCFWNTEITFSSTDYMGFLCCRPWLYQLYHSAGLREVQL